jgi:DNA-binding LacI/PurR family transcriptional regulator
MSAVARAAQVSPATVSRVLNGAPTVNDTHRERVLAAVAELNYRPNRVGRNLRRQRTSMIGVVVSDIENPHFNSMVRVVEQVAYREGYRVLLCNTDETPAKQREYLEVLEDERVLGVLLSPSDPGGPEIAALLDMGIPVVAVDRPVEDARADAVVVDNVAATRTGTDHLIERGHRRIGFISGAVEVGTGKDRLEGYRRAVAAVGAEPLVAVGGFRVEGGRRACAELLAAHPDLTALMVANNLMTIGALDELRRTGLRIPAEVALVAVDDPPWARFTEPPLTVLAQPVREMAEGAMTLLLERIEGRRSEPRQLVLPLELHVRESSAHTLS